MARVERWASPHAVATVYPDERVEIHHLGVMGDDYFGVAQNGDTMYAQRGQNALMAFHCVRARSERWGRMIMVC